MELIRPSNGGCLPRIVPSQLSYSIISLMMVGCGVQLQGSSGVTLARGKSVCLTDLCGRIGFSSLRILRKGGSIGYHSYLCDMS